MHGLRAYAVAQQQQQSPVQKLLPGKASVSCIERKVVQYYLRLCFLLPTLQQAEHKLEQQPMVMATLWSYAGIMHACGQLALVLI